MVLAITILLLQFPALPAVAGAAHAPLGSSVAAKSAKSTANAKNSLPGTLDGRFESSSRRAAEPIVGSNTPDVPEEEPISERSMANVYLPPPAAFRPKIEPVEHSDRLWFALGAAEHGSAAFDAWSTRRAVSQGRVEADPMMRPFANSAVMYGAIQVVPFGLDYLAHRMERSTNWTRHVWWVPQSLATAAFVFSGSYNVAHTR